MAGQGCLYGDLRRLLVADLAHEHDVRVLAQNGPQRGGESETRFFLDLHLHDTLDPVFDGVFNRDDVDAFALDLVDAGVERRRLAGPGRAGHQEDSFVVLEQPSDGFRFARIEPKGVERFDRAARVEDADDDLFPELCRQGRDTQVDRLSVHRHASATVLRPQAIGDIE